MPKEKDQDLDLDELDESAEGADVETTETDPVKAEDDSEVAEDDKEEESVIPEKKEKKEKPVPKAPTRGRSPRSVEVKKEDAENENDEETETVIEDAPSTPREIASSLGDMKLDLAKTPLSGKARRYLTALSTEPLVASFIPLDVLNPEDKEHQFGINGLIFKLPRGQMLNVPAPVASFIQETINAKR